LSYRLQLPMPPGRSGESDGLNWPRWDRGLGPSEPVAPTRTGALRERSELRAQRFSNAIAKLGATQARGRAGRPQSTSTSKDWPIEGGSVTPSAVPTTARRGKGGLRSDGAVQTPLPHFVYDADCAASTGHGVGESGGRAFGLCAGAATSTRSLNRASIAASSA
jgi:hypothetical protein